MMEVGGKPKEVSMMEVAGCWHPLKIYLGFQFEVTFSLVILVHQLSKKASICGEHSAVRKGRVDFNHDFPSIPSSECATKNR